MRYAIVSILIGVLAVTGSLGAKKMPNTNSVILSSTSFTNQSRLSGTYTCDGKNISPQLSWRNIPVGVKSFAIICDDPDAPSKKAWVHWLIFNIPSSTTSLAEGVPTTPSFGDGTSQGTNDFGKSGYGGACPPHGHGVHHYIFTLYALDTTLALKPGISREVLENAMKGHILATGQLIGTYSR